MSASKRAKERRSKRSRLSKHKRAMIASQPKQEQRRIAEEQRPDAPSMSPARRAFQDDWADTS